MNNDIIPNKEQCAICGLFCPACQMFIDTKGNPEKLEGRAKAFGIAIEELQCKGCRSDQLCFFCREHCYMKPCATKKGYDFCGECPEYPCAELKTFQAQAPHRLELWESQTRIKEVGYETWYLEMIDRYTCPECKTINSAYDSTCRNCGADPSCEYVRIHKDETEAMMKNFPGQRG